MKLLIYIVRNHAPLSTVEKHLKFLKSGQIKTFWIFDRIKNCRGNMGTPLG